ncbi:conserved hypothetical protein [Verticillium alfalfae VaMs.102]|uniref:Thioredoxin domain-containing protein n=1 Tax=Verticillium alfalfae (strain VaMs.102 / ATCC MYA-4576 / FGSC 10136) TaxID=526221 RepID=C9SA19_VERA1|nr:conserved hypothetical protein [Verticillium alfalfae VaMs.102]EEY16232.1 conserved hypothetical protein [Verticillium alfalfae VaMs.102]
MSGLISIQSPSQWQDVLNSTNVVVADFYADWCGPCKAIAPHFEKMANEYSKPKKAAFCKINVDTQSTISRAHGVSAMPTFVIFHAGKPIETIRGANPPALANAVANAMKLPDKTKTGGASFRHPRPHPRRPGRRRGGRQRRPAAVAALQLGLRYRLDPAPPLHHRGPLRRHARCTRDAARGAGPAGKTRAPPARPLGLQDAG